MCSPHKCWHSRRNWCLYSAPDASVDMYRAIGGGSDTSRAQDRKMKSPCIRASGRVTSVWRCYGPVGEPDHRRIPSPSSGSCARTASADGEHPGRVWPASGWFLQAHIPLFSRPARDTAVRSLQGPRSRRTARQGDLICAGSLLRAGPWRPGEVPAAVE